MNTMRTRTITGDSIKSSKPTAAFKESSNEEPNVKTETSFKETRMIEENEIEGENDGDLLQEVDDMLREVGLGDTPVGQI